MYEYLHGMLVSVMPSYVVLDVNGVGYKLYMANPYQLAAKEKTEQTLYIHQAIRDDAHLLYGFISFEERQLFERLIQVSGIGPKSALAILAASDHKGLIQAIQDENITYLTKFPGVGKKTAQQMVIDLQGKLDEITLFAEELWDLADTKAPVTSGVEKEAIEALQALGYSDRDIKKVVKALEKETIDTTSDYISQALKVMMKK